MQLEHNQFLNLIAEAGDMDIEKAEKYLFELVGEIKQSLNDGEDYEIEGFGIFSSLSNRLIFIPSNELETEINYKYVGMEPIELEKSKPSFEEPLDDLENRSNSKSDDDRFTDLITGDITESLLAPSENTDSEMWEFQADKVDESADSFFASLMGEDSTPPLVDTGGIDTSETKIENDLSDIFADSFEETYVEQETSDTEDSSPDTDAVLNFDENNFQLEDVDETEIVPVVNNINTEELQPQPKSIKTSKKLKKEKEKKEKRKYPKKDTTKIKKQQVSAWQWILFILLLCGGLATGLGYFNIIEIPFITPDTTYPKVSTTNQNQKPTTEDGNKDSNDTINGNLNGSEQVTEPVVEQNVSVDNNSSTATSQYGLTGQTVPAGNNGYTIVLFSLRNQNNAVIEAQKLIDAGYRGFLTPVKNDRFGMLYRVSLGQFISLADATIAADEVENLLPENYIIKKIN